MKQWAVRITFLSLVLLLAVLSWFILVPVQLAKPYTMKVGAQRTLAQLAQYLADEQVIRNRLVMIALARLMGIDRKIKAGVYRFSDSLTMLDILKRLAEGRPDEVSLTVIEGWTFRQLRQALQKIPEMRHTTENWSDAHFLSALGVPQASMEGLVFPSTYFFVPESTDLMLLRRAYLVMQQKLAASWQSRDRGLPYRTPYEMLIVASLIEKETAQAQDRPLVAAVFVNRLKKGMRLQTDPAVIYGLGDNYQGTLRKIDLQRDTPFNTYTRLGLPPTPIALPSEASLLAAAHPAKSKVLYFVAAGQGRSYFSETLNEHNQAVREYLLKKGP